MKTKQRNSVQGSSDLPAKLSQPAQRALAVAGVQRLGQLTRFTEKQVSEWHGIGPNALAQLRDALRAKGWSFAPEKKN